MDREWSIESVTVEDRARMEIKIARDEGIDPHSLADTHMRIGAAIRVILAKEGD